MRSMIRRVRYGLLLVPILVALATVIDRLWGPVFGIWGWAEVGAALLVLGAMGFALVEEFMRPPNPYSRIHHLYDLRDVAKSDTLYAASPTLLWQMLPLVVAATVLLVLG